MTQHRVLVVGAGIAGPVLAYWLGKHGHRVVVVERSAHPSQAGQVIDIEGPSQEIVARMGLLDKIRAAATHELGASCVDESNNAVGTFPAGQSAGASKEIEIMRPRLGKILYSAAQGLDNVEFRLGCTISRLEQLGRSVQVEISNDASGTSNTEEFDIVVACDGLRSRTRDMIFSKTQSRSCVKSVNVFVAFFELPAQPQDAPYARLYNLPGRRSAFMKPIDDKISSAYLGVARYDQALHEARESRDVNAQRRIMADRFRGQGWETDRLAKAALEADNFYFEEISQVKLDAWSRGRCVLLGDTAWCPSPLTGQGTNAAILGAYVLADSVIRHGDDVEKAFEEYEGRMRPYIDKIQPIPLGGYLPKMLNPDTALGIWVLRTLVWLVSWLQLYKFLPDWKVEFEGLPDLR